MNARSQENLTYLGNPNMKAFLYMLQMAEGTHESKGGHGFFTSYGGSRIASLLAHPNRVISKWGYSSSAAGAYQFLSRTWAGLVAKLGLTDFSAQSQNIACVELIRGRGALNAVLSGQFQTAITLCRKEWASLPGAGYGQGERTMAQCLKWIQEGLGNGGVASGGMTGGMNTGLIAAAAFLFVVLFLD